MSDKKKTLKSAMEISEIIGKDKEEATKIIKILIALYGVNPRLIVPKSD